MKRRDNKTRHTKKSRNSNMKRRKSHAREKTPFKTDNLSDSEAAFQNIASNWLYFHHYWSNFDPLSDFLKP